MPNITVSFRVASLIAATALGSGFSANAYAISGKLDSAASLPLASGIPREAVRNALEHQEAEFIGGSFVNSKSTIHFAGDTLAASRMARRVAELPGMSVSVTFIRADDVSDWHVIHDARNGAFQIAFNLNSKRIDLEKLAVPYSKDSEPSQIQSD